MPGQVTVTYFHHSGFMAAVEDTLLIFDYWRGENNNLTGETGAFGGRSEGIQASAVFRHP